MHFKRRRRKRGGHKGCCGMCCLRTTDGRRNGRRMTLQEQASVFDMLQQIEDLELVCRPRIPVLHGYYLGGQTPVHVLKVVREIETGEWDDRILTHGSDDLLLHRASVETAHPDLRGVPQVEQRFSSGEGSEGKD